MESVSLGTCPVCSQGRQLVARDEQGNFIIYCEDCESLWKSPEDVLSADTAYRNDTGGKLTLVSWEELSDDWKSKVFVTQLVLYVPEIKRLLEESIKDNDELLPYVFLGDVRRFVLTEAESDRLNPTQPAARILRFFEDQLKIGGKYMQGFIHVSFTDNFPDESPVLLALKPLMGPLLQQQLKDEGKII